MVMDYHRLNKQTVKNNYPLPLITDLVDAMGNKKLFTKIMYALRKVMSGRRPSLHMWGHLNQW